MEKPETLNLRGMELTDAGRYDKAIDAFNQALEQEPHNASVLYNRGEALRRAGRLGEARADLEAVLAIEGEAPDLLLALGLVAYEDDDYEGATDRYERALVLKEAFPEAWNDLGVVRFRSGDYLGARGAFEKAVALDAKYDEAWLNLRDTYDELGLKAEYAKASEALRGLKSAGDEEGEEE